MAARGFSPELSIITAKCLTLDPDFRPTVEDILSREVVVAKALELQIEIPEDCRAFESGPRLPKPLQFVKHFVKDRVPKSVKAGSRLKPVNHRRTGSGHAPELLPGKEPPAIGDLAVAAAAAVGGVAAVTGQKAEDMRQWPAAPRRRRHRRRRSDEQLENEDMEAGAYGSAPSVHEDGHGSIARDDVGHEDARRSRGHEDALDTFSNLRQTTSGGRASPKMHAGQPVSASPVPRPPARRLRCTVPRLLPLNGWRCAVLCLSLPGRACRKRQGGPVRLLAGHCDRSSARAYRSRARARVLACTLARARAWRGQRGWHVPVL